MNKSNPEKIIKRLLTVIVLIVIVFSAIPRVQNIFVLSTRRDQLEKNKEELLIKNEQLIQDKDDLNNLATLERLARERLGMTKEGEKVLIKQLD